MSNLENLKKQAKALVRLHRERSYHLSCVARETLPKYAALSDREILAADFKLADAQELIARQHGCDSWKALKARAEAGEPEPASPFGPGVLTAVPMLYVADVRRSLDYYAGVLGFEIAQVSGDPPFFAEVWRGGAKIALRFTHRPPIDPEVRKTETMLLQAGCRVGDVKAIYLEHLAAGAKFAQALQRDAFGPQAYIVEDPDGNLVWFSEPGPDSIKRARAEATSP